MKNTALKSFFVENYALFADRMEFTCVSDSSKKEHMLNTFAIGDYELNKVSYIYGANGAGKTMFCKIVKVIQHYLKFSPFTITNDRDIQNRLQLGSDEAYNFVYDLSYENKPTTFGVELIMDGCMYSYQFSILNGKIMSEKLSKKYRRSENILIRSSADYKDITVKSELKSFDALKNVVKENALCLALAETLNNEFARKIIDVIMSIKIFNIAQPKLNPAELDCFSDEKMRLYTRVLEKADPTIQKISIELSEEDIQKRVSDVDDFENKEEIKKRIRIGVKSQHKLYNKGVLLEESIENSDFFNKESMGTVKLFTMLPYLYEILETGGILILDEIDNGLHLSLVRDIISLFSDNESNPNGAQLVCSSHQPLLITNNVKRDQVWMLVKDDFGKSSIHRLSKDEYIRANSNLANRIIEGAFGTVINRFFKLT